MHLRITQLRCRILAAGGANNRAPTRICIGHAPWHARASAPAGSFFRNALSARPLGSCSATETRSAGAATALNPTVL
jgi:hypothetical protein